METQDKPKKQKKHHKKKEKEAEDTAAVGQENLLTEGDESIFSPNKSLACVDLAPLPENFKVPAYVIYEVEDEEKEVTNTIKLMT